MRNLNLNTIKKSTVFLMTVALVGFTSCKKDKEDDIQTEKSIVEIVVGNNNFSLLKTALVEADLVSVLEGKGPFTVFAPNNAAFIAAGLDTEAKIKAVPVETLKEILLYHVIGQRIPASAIAMASNSPVKTAADIDVFVTKNASGVFVNGASVMQADINASNGVIHVINTVLMPPAGNIVQAAQDNPNFTFLVAAVVKANLATALSGAGPLTVFAPTNQAFIAAGFADIAAVQNADATTLANILTYHVISGRILSSDLTEGANPVTLNSATVAITLNGGAKVKGIGNATASSITQANLLTTNGVIHVINKVLLPTLPL